MLQVEIIHSWLQLMSGTRCLSLQLAPTCTLCKHPRPAQMLMQLAVQLVWPSGLPQALATD